MDRDIDPYREAPSPRSTILWLVDGLGWAAYRRWVEGDSGRVASAWARHADPITSVFPTTTTSALVSLSTGAAPRTHGVAGHRLYLPLWGALADMIRMSPAAAPGQDLLVGPNWRPELVSGSPTLFRRGLRGAALSRDRFAGTGFTRILYDGAEFVGYSTASDLAHQLKRLIGRRAPPPVIFVYWDELDTVHHLRGPDPFAFDVEMSRVAHLVRSVARALAVDRRRETLLVVTGDHGLVRQTRRSRLAVERHPEIVQELRFPPAGDRRAPMFAVRPGRRAALEAALRAHLPNSARVLPIRAAIDLGLFGPGPAHPELAERLGDLLVLVLPPAGVTYSAPGNAYASRFLLGAHGGLQREELLVPLVAGPLSEFV